MSIPVRCLSGQVKSDVSRWFDREVKKWSDLRKLHRSVWGWNQEEYEVWHSIMGDIIFTYRELQTDFVLEVPDCE